MCVLFTFHGAGTDHRPLPRQHALRALIYYIHSLISSQYLVLLNDQSFASNYFCRLGIASLGPHVNNQKSRIRAQSQHTGSLYQQTLLV